MSENTEGRSTGGFSGTTTDEEYESASFFGALWKHLRRKAKFVGMVAALAVTTWGIWTVDETVSKDVIVFAALTAVTLVYLLIALRSDIKME